MSLEKRKSDLETVKNATFDAIIVGGGINGAAIFNQLCSEGYRVLLVDKSDFAGGTSQASAMMIWGGLIHLRNLNLLTVWRLCASRERMIREKQPWVSPRTFRYIPANESGRNRFWAYSGLYFYWLMGRGRRSRPQYKRSFDELSFLNTDEFRYALEYEEACVEPSDARFVLEWLLPHREWGNIALNYCSVQGGGYDATAKVWHIELADLISGVETTARARWVINAAGTWTDKLNERFSIESPFKHVFGKGVFIGINRPRQHRLPLMIETKNYRDCMGLIPWGPISLWGPTETVITDIEDGFTVTRDDVQYLLAQLNRHLAGSVSARDIVSLRCGVRPLVVDRHAPEQSSCLHLSRKFRIYRDKHLPWISTYGGKFTSCIPVASMITRLLRDCLKPEAIRPSFAISASQPEFDSFPGLEQEVPSASWCASHEMCWNLEDYLRRRTNISQWIPRGGLGSRNENVAHLNELAKAFCSNDDNKAEAAVREYESKIKHGFDDLIFALDASEQPRYIEANADYVFASG